MDSSEKHSIRRAEKDKIRKRRYDQMKPFSAINANHFPETEEEFRLRTIKEAETPCRCSRKCCGNPRKHFGEKTLQEYKADDSEEQMLNEI